MEDYASSRAISAEIAESVRILSGFANEGHVLNLCISTRRKLLYKSIVSASGGGGKAFSAFMAEHEDNLINPILVPSLLAMAIIGLGRGRHFLELFLTGAPMPDFEKEVANVTLDTFESSSLRAFPRNGTEIPYRDSICSS